MLPDMMLVATGMAMAFKLRHEQRCAITWFGDGSTSRGDFHEAMNWAGVQKLPVIFVLENNQYAYSTPTGAQFAVDPVERAAAYGFPGISVDGNDAEAMFEATRQARERALAGEGPTLLEAVTMRMHGHAAHDDMKYVPKEQVEEWRKKDPIERQEARLRALGVDLDPMRAEVRDDDRRRHAGGARDADARPGRPPPTASSTTATTSCCSATATRRGAASRRAPDMATMTYLQAISDGMREEMRADDRVFVMGEDIGVFGGAFKVTDGFIEEFGADRVMDTPLAESGIIGTAIGAAVVGHAPDRRDAVRRLHHLRLRPARQRRREDVLPPGPAREHHRAPASGGGFSGGPYHSQNPEAWFMHAPGLKVVAPSTAEDAKGLLIGAIRDHNPVLFLEHKHLYRRVKGEVARRPLHDAVHGARRPRGHGPHGRSPTARWSTPRWRRRRTSTARRSRSSTCARSCRSTRRRSSRRCARRQGR